MRTKGDIRANHRIWDERGYGYTRFVETRPRIADRLRGNVNTVTATEASNVGAALPLPPNRDDDEHHRAAGSSCLPAA